MVSYIYWDPSRDIFSLPFLPRPIGWYGVLFALGFFLGHRIITFLLKCRMARITHFTEKDVIWPLFLKKLKTEENVKACLEGPIKRELDEWEGGTPSDMLKLGSLAALNSQKYHRDPEDVSLKRFFLAQRWKKVAVRLRLEEVFRGGLTSLKTRAGAVSESLTFAIVVGVLVGARLGHILFYEDLQFYLKDPLAVLRVWEGGLASHGAAIGALIALFIFLRRIRKRYETFSFFGLLDLIVIPTCLAGGLVRIGNFINQEILGSVTSVPWAVIFGHPADGSAPAPRHPAQLYEALFYFACFGFLYRFHHRFGEKRGRLTGLFFVFVFGFRFLIEFVKERQSVYTPGGLLMGQLLSLPLVALGLYLIWSPKRRPKAALEEASL